MKQPARPIGQITGIFIVIAIAALGYFWGRRSAHNLPIETSFQVAGDSMAPTLSGGMVCRIRHQPRTWAIGDIVAIRWDGRTRVKRIAALGGDTVTRNNGRLFINDRRLEDILADRNDDAFIPPSLLSVSADPDDWSTIESDPSWIRYTHRNPHQAGRVTAVMDDYPINRTTRRLLNPVDRLAINVRPKSTVDDVSSYVGNDWTVAFFHSGGVVVRRTKNGRARCGDFETTQSIESSSTWMNSDLDAAHPIAVQMTMEENRRWTLEVVREIEYRDDGSAEKVTYPLTLNAEEVFVVGDNVPISIDSRHVGPLNVSAIVGTLTPPR